MAEKKQQPAVTEEPKKPVDDSTPTCPGDSTPTCPEPSHQTWPEVVGLTAEEAAKKIKEDRPGIHILLVPPGIADRMFRYDRVILYLDSEGKVRSVPGIG